MEHTSAIIIGKTVYGERDLIVHAITAETGKLDLIASGALSIGKSKFPVLDIFREFELDYTAPTGGGTLGKLAEAELANDFSAVANELTLYRFAGKLGDFVLKHAVSELPMPFVYDALKHAYEHLARRAAGNAAAWEPAAAGVIVKLAYLQENGMLPEFQDQASSDFFDQLLDAGLEGASLPQLPLAYWTQLTNYLNTLLA